jgi:hypothetical protein
MNWEKVLINKPVTSNKVTASPNRRNAKGIKIFEAIILKLNLFKITASQKLLFPGDKYNSK